MSDDADLLFKALADPSRRKLLDLLHAHDGQTLNELCEHLDMTRQGVTQHLAVLEEANLVATMRRGREKLHFLNPVPLQEIYERWIAKFEKRRLKALVPIEGSPPSLLAPPSGCPFHPRCPYRFEPCDNIVPPLVAPDGGHLDACHLPFERKLELGRERADRRLGTAA